MMIFFLGAGLCGLGAALSIDDPAALSLCLAGIGLFSGIYHPAGLGLIARGVERISIGMAYNGIFGNVGLAAAPLVTGLVNWLWGPAAAYLVLAGLNFSGLVFMSRYALEEPERPAQAEDRKVGGYLGPFLVLLLAMMLGGIAYRGSSVTMPAYFELRIEGIMTWVQSWWPAGPTGNVVATLLTAMSYLVGAIGQYVGGRVGERWDPRYGYVVFHALAVPAVLAMAFLAEVPLFLAGMVYLFFLLGMQPMENTLVARLSPPAWKHSAYGAKFILTFGVGSLAVKLVGGVEKAWGVATVFLILAAVGLAIVASATLLVRVTRHRPQAPAQPEAPQGDGPPMAVRQPVR
ncbi:MAG: MFS transporter [Pseudomonadota bacterium]